MKRWKLLEIDSTHGNPDKGRDITRGYLIKGWRLVSVVSKEKDPGNQLCVRYYLTKRLTRKEYKNHG